ncbi:MAG: TauD/TfdA family dioxygenase [Polyangiaceae bacterium]
MVAQIPSPSREGSQHVSSVQRGSLVDPKEAAVSLHDDWLRLWFGPSAKIRYADFHYIWLRHNADNDRHPLTGERILDSSEIPDTIRPLKTRIESSNEGGSKLHVSWSDGVESVYDLAWLASEAYAPNRDAAPPPPSDLSAIELFAEDFENPEAMARACLERVRTHGAVVVRGFKVNGPEHDTELIVEGFEKIGQRVIETHFGRIEDLRPDNTTNKNTDQLGYTDARIELHTDQPFIERPPRYQILQSIIAAESGGDNFVVDAEAAAKYLRDEDAHHYELLTTVPVRFHRKQKAFESLVTAPVVQLNGRPHDGGFMVRFSYFTMAPHQVPFAKMRAWYNAYNHFTRIVRDERNQYRFKLDPGDFVLYDNQRMLHARSGFRGARWLRGIYLDS